jgi:release factor glutamine methyltransferase
MSQITLAEQVARGLERLVAAGIREDEARRDAELLARHALGWDRAAWLASRRDTANSRFISEYDALVTRRAAREPVSLILGRREFWGLEFDTRPGALIPRPETELIVEEALEEVTDTHAPLVADVGTGSGCLAVALATELPHARIVATDVSAPALEIARANAEKHGLDARVHLVRANLLDGLAAQFDLIVSNPPYVKSGDRAGLGREVRDYEPDVALFGGPDGLDAIRALLARAPACLKPDGRFILEFGYGQEPDVVALARSAGFDVLRIRTDLQDIPRVAVLALMEPDGRSSR